MKGNAALRILVNDDGPFAANFDFDADFLKCLAHSTSARGFTILTLAAGKFPHAGQMLGIIASPRHENAALTPDKCDGDVEVLHRGGESLSQKPQRKSAPLRPSRVRCMSGQSLTAGRKRDASTKRA